MNITHDSLFRILLVQHAADFSGSTVSGHLIAAGMRQAGWNVHAVFGMDGPYQQQYRNLGCEVSTLPHQNWLHGGGLIRSTRRIAREWGRAAEFMRLMKQVEPDLVYVNSIVSLPAAVAARRLSIPCIWHIRELFSDVGGEIKAPLLGGKWLVQSLLKKLSCHQIAISQAVLENVLGISEVNGKVSIIPNAVEHDFFDNAISVDDARKELGLRMNVPLVGVPGTLRPVKGHFFFLEAAAALIRTIPNVLFALTGTGEPSYVKQLQEKVKECGLSSQIHFLGNVTRMPIFFRACDVICIPSISESFGRTAIEAFACGTPVVATAVGGMKETIEHGQNGYLVSYGNTAELTERLRVLLNNGLLRNRFSSAGREKALKQYSSASYWHAVNSLVKDRRKITK